MGAITRPRFRSKFLVYISILLLVFGLGGCSKQSSQVANQKALGVLRADFPEPFLPTVKGADETVLAQVIQAYESDERPKAEKVDIFERFLEENPEDPWAPSVSLNLGVYYRESGRFSRALPHLQQANLELAQSTDSRTQALSDLASGEYAVLLAHLGRTDELEDFLLSLKGRSFQGKATELVTGASYGLRMMKRKPEISFWCGPAALRRIGQLQESWTEAKGQEVRSLSSTFRGTSLTQVSQLSERLDMNYQMAFREPGSQILTPAVAHWKVGHFGALLDPQNGLYPVQDDTAGFLHDEVRLTKEALDEESSGYFLVPAGPLPSGWRTVAFEEGNTVWGRGYVGPELDGDATGDDDVICGDEEPCPMTTWSAHAMVVSLRLVDTPVGLSPAAFSVPFRVTYAQREMGQPAVFDYSNLGPKWTSNWTSYVTDNRSSTGKVRLYKTGGGTDEYTFSTSTTTSDRGSYSQAYLTDTGQGFTLDWPNGSQDHYTKLIGSRYHLTRRTSPQGNDTTLQYDDIGRLSQIIDPSGRVMTLSYELTDDLFKVTKVTDPFGRSADFTYTADGHLESITDVIGLTSSFQYGENDFVNTLTTPYGTTTFAYADGMLDFSDLDIEHRILEITDAEGRKHRVENAEGGIHVSIVAPGPGLGGEKDGDPLALTASNNTTGLVPTNVTVPFSEFDVPTGIPVLPDYQDARNTFYWKPHQLDEFPDTSKATIYHFLYLNDPNTVFVEKSRVLESVKRPLENRVWYAYPGSDTNPGYFGGDDNPTHVARVLGDGTTQLRRYQYNAQGNVTQMTDPAGRVFDYTYSGNGIDLESVATSGQTLFSASYDSNHNIVTLTGADGETSQFSYDARGLMQTALNPLGELSTFTHTPTGNLSSISGPLGLMANFSYDSAERVGTATDSEGYSVQVAYDNGDRPLSVTYPDGTQDTLAYDRLDLVRTEDRINRVTQSSFDNVRRLTSITDPNSGVTSMAYGLYEVPTSLTDPEGNVTLLERDLHQRLARKQYPDGSAQTIEYQLCCGRLDSVTDALGQSKTYSYFIDNQLKQIQYSGATPTVTFTNDTFLPRHTSMTDGLGTHTMNYGAIGSPGANRLTNITGPFGDQASLTYDAAGRLSGQIVNGEAENVTFDSLWRPTSVTNALDTFQMAYLGKTGQMTEMTSSVGPTVQYAYTPNNLDRRLSQIKNLGQGGQVLSQFDYTYDPVGQITTLVQTHGVNCSGGEGDGGDGDGGDDDDDCNCGCKGGGKGKGKGHQKKKGNGHYEHGNGHGYGHDHDSGCDCKEKGKKSGHKNQKGKGHREHGNGHGYGHDHDSGCDCKKNGKKSGHKNQKGKGHREHGNGHGYGHNHDSDCDHDDKSHLWDWVKKILSEVWGWDVSDWDDEDNGGGGTGEPTVETFDFSYDNLSQLVGVNLNGNPYARYTFDNAGNLTSLTLEGETTALTYNNLNQVTSPGTPAFDAKGQADTDAQGRTFEWDEQGRVIAIVQGNQRSEFEYDGLSRRSIIREIVDGQVESEKLYWWLGGSIVCERDGLQTGFPITKRYFGQGVLQGQTKLFYTTDHLGSVRQLVDETGEVVADYRYSIYGERTKVCGDLDSDYGFAGLFHHEPSGLDLATYRLYDAEQRRFISRDPLGESVDYNLYRYGGNNPVRYVDPEGLEPGEGMPGPDRSVPVDPVVTTSGGSGIIGWGDTFYSRAVTPYVDGNRLNITLGINVTVPQGQTTGFSTSPFPGGTNHGWDVVHNETGEMFFWHAKTDPMTFAVSNPGSQHVWTTLSIPSGPDVITIDATFTLFAVSANNPGVPSSMTWNISATFRKNPETGIYEEVPCP